MKCITGKFESTYCDGINETGSWIERRDFGINHYGQWYELKCVRACYRKDGTVVPWYRRTNPIPKGFCKDA